MSIRWCQAGWGKERVAPEKYCGGIVEYRLVMGLVIIFRKVHIMLLRLLLLQHEPQLVELS